MQVRAVEEKSRTFELSFSSEIPVQRWFGAEILSHDESAVSLERLLTVGTVLFNHGFDPQIGKVPIAKIERAWVKDYRGYAEVTFDDDEDSDRIFKKVQKGMLKGISARYSVSSWEEVAAGKMSSNGRFMGPAEIALKWEPLEISFEPVPADPSVGVGRGMDAQPPKLGEDCRRDLTVFEAQLQHNKNFL